MRRFESYRGRQRHRGKAVHDLAVPSGDRVHGDELGAGLIRVARRSGASLGQLAEFSGLDRETVTAIVAEEVRTSD